jgi:hypothetical protein
MNTESCPTAFHQILPFPTERGQPKSCRTAFRQGHDAPARVNVLVWWKGDRRLSGRRSGNRTLSVLFLYPENKGVCAVEAHNAAFECRVG